METAAYVLNIDTIASSGRCAGSEISN